MPPRGKTKGAQTESKKKGAGEVKSKTMPRVENSIRYLVTLLTCTSIKYTQKL